MVHERDRAVERRGRCAQRVEVVEDGERCANGSARSDGAAEAEERQLAGDRSHDGRALPAAHPMRDFDGLEPHVVETVRLLEEGATAEALRNAFGTLLICAAAAAAGIALATL